jgi:uncharacterized membrane protein YgdD (TMEM256/DUF423 family)
MNAKVWIVIAGLLGAAAVGLGAFHAHGLNTMLEKRGDEPAKVAKRMHDCDVAVRYQMYHALALLAVGILAMRQPSVLLTSAGALLLLGVLLFSGGLYLIVFADNIVHWVIVPSGGLSMILGWVVLALSAVRLTAGPRN